MLQALAKMIKGEPRPPSNPQVALSVPAGATLFHISHWRAGSRWILRMLTDAFGAEVLVKELPGLKHLLGDLTPGKIYPSTYISKLEFDNLSSPADTRRVVVIRDPRDTLVSLYFSVLVTHAVVGGVEKWRWFLRRVDKEQGLLYLMESGFHNPAMIQRSWLEAGEPVMKLEDFMSDRAGSFRRFFREFWRMDIPDKAIEALAVKHSFERYSGGRQPGQEDTGSHYRRGVHGDWRQHFTPKVVDRFKARYGDLLIMARYEKDHSWGL